MSSRPRTPRYWPRMKVRGARRKWIAPYQRLAGAFDEAENAFGSAVREMARIYTIIKEYHAQH